jgi:hypothetical protein
VIPDFMGGLNEVLLAGDVIAVEDRASLMSGDLHAYSFGDSHTHHVGYLCLPTGWYDICCRSCM